MSRVKRGVAGRARKKKLFKMTKGYKGLRNNLIRLAIETLHKGLNYAFRDRKAKKRDFRKLWITRISAAAKQNNVSYSRLINSLKQKNIELDRKILADIALHDPVGFKEIIKVSGVAVKN